MKSLAAQLDVIAGGINVKAAEADGSTLSKNERTIAEIYFAWGLLSNGGLHGLLFSLEPEVPIDRLIGSLYDLKLTEFADGILEACDLLAEYVVPTPEEQLSADDFRRHHVAALTMIEERLYAREGEVIEALLQLARSPSME